MNSSPSTLWKRIAVGAARTGTVNLLLLCLALVSPLGRVSAGPVGPGETRSAPGDRAPARSAVHATAHVLPLSCGVSGFIAWTTVSTTGEIVRQCTLTVPTNGSLFVSADGSLQNWDGAYGVRLWINIDSTADDPGTTRWVDVYDDAGNGTDKSVAVSALKPVAAGTHTVYMMAGRWGGTGTVMMRDPSLSAIFIPATDSELLACGESAPLVWTPTVPDIEPIRQCTLQIPQHGMVFLSADGTAAYSDGEYEAGLRFGVDSPTGDADTERFVNVYSDAGDGTDEVFALSAFRVVGAGEHTFYLSGWELAGPGTPTIWNPTLTAIHIPSSGSEVVTCGSLGAEWSTGEDEPGVVLQCTADVPTGGWAYLSADGSLGELDGSYEAQFTMQVDGAEGDLGMHRWVNVYTDSSDGTDKSFRLSALARVGAGERTFLLMGQRSNGLGTVFMYDPALSVIVLPSRWAFLPLVLR